MFSYEFFNEWKTFNVDLSDSIYWGRHEELKFIWDGTTGDRAWLDNVNYSPSSAVPEPGSFVLFAASSLGPLFFRCKLVRLRPVMRLRRPGSVHSLSVQTSLDIPYADPGQTD